MYHKMTRDIHDLKVKTYCTSWVNPLPKFTFCWKGITVIKLVIVIVSTHAFQILFKVS